ncbi:MAG: GFA family protein [Pseudolabrys sp.]|nr:GFA family protein [Pseudolabrys sp.]
MKIHASCHCGYVTFEAEADPERVVICHCTDCQVSTGTAFRSNVPVPGDSFRLLSGEPAVYVKTTAESGNPRAQTFCPKCGTHLYSTNPGDGPKPAYMVRTGILRERDQLAPKLQIWTRSARPWITEIAAISSHETQPGTSHLR